jgi:hypothetical protein
MPRRNYGFDKRQKELAKREKRAAKQQRHLERRQALESPPETKPSETDPPRPEE